MADETDQNDVVAKPRDLVSNIALGIAAVAALGGFAAITSSLWPSQIEDPQEVLRIATEEYVAGNLVIAGELAATANLGLEAELPGSDGEAELEEPLPPEGELQAPEEEPSEGAVEAEDRTKELIALRNFLVGVGKAAKAEPSIDARDRREFQRQAIDLLRKVQESGYPPGRKVEGNLILGNALFDLGEHDESILALSAVIADDPTKVQMLLPRIVRSQLKSNIAQPADALTNVDTFLAFPALTTVQQWQGELMRLEALIRLSQYRDVDKMLREIKSRPRSNDVIVANEEEKFLQRVNLLQSRRFVKEAIDRYGRIATDPTEDRTDAAQALWSVIRMLKDIERDGVPTVAAEAKLWQARAFLVAGDNEAALREFTGVRQLRPFGAEAIAGGIEEIELLAARGMGVDLIQTVRYMIREIGDANGYDSAIVPYPEFQRRIIEAIVTLRETGNYAYAVDALKAIPPVIQVSDTLMQEGNTYSRWAEATLASGLDKSGTVDRSSSMLARSRYRSAGSAYAKAAKLKFDTPEYVDSQWAAIDAFQKGRHYRRSIDLLKDYVRYEERNRLPRGYVAYARALLAEGNIDAALQQLEKCIIEHPRDPLRYDARLLSAQTFLEKEMPEKAEEYLLANLQDVDLAPRSPAWRDSLLALGEMHYHQGYQTHLDAQLADDKAKRQMMMGNQDTLRKAIKHLTYALEYYGFPIAQDAAYLAAKSHVLASRWPRLESRAPETLEAARRKLKQQADQELDSASDLLGRLRRDLVAKEEDAKISKKESAVLRNCFMAEADVLKEKGAYEEAASAYQSVEIRYINEPTVLEAIMGRIQCIEKLGRNSEANLLVRQAGVMLERIPPEWDSEFDRITRFSRSGWRQYLDWMESRLEKQNA